MFEGLITITSALVFGIMFICIMFSYTVDNIIHYQSLDNKYIGYIYEDVEDGEFHNSRQ